MLPQTGSCNPRPHPQWLAECSFCQAKSGPLGLLGPKHLESQRLTLHLYESSSNHAGSLTLPSWSRPCSMVAAWDRQRVKTEWVVTAPIGNFDGKPTSLSRASFPLTSATW